MEAVPERKKPNSFDRTLETLSAGILVIMVAEVGFSVFCRYVLTVTFRWSEEIAIILFVYLIFLAIPIVMSRRLHIRIDYIVLRLPTKARKAVEALVEFIIALVSLVLAVSSVQVVLNLGMEPMSATYLPIGIIYGAVGLSGLLVLVVTVRSFIGNGR